MMKFDVEKEEKALKRAQTFKESENLYSITEENEKMYLGIQWDDIDSKNLKKTTYNIIGQIADVKLAAIVANKLTVQRTVDETEQAEEDLVKASKIFTAIDRKNWERLRFDYMLNQIVLDGMQQGIAVLYYYWDTDITHGNITKSVGDINAELIDMVDYYVSNPYEIDEQKQDWIKLCSRKTLRETKAWAKEKEVPEDMIDMIKPDDDSTHMAFERGTDDHSSDDEKLVTITRTLKKRDGTVYTSLSTKDVEIEPWKDLEMPLYPVAVYTYKTRKKFAYGEAEMTRYIENQKMANVQESARHLHALMMAVPRLLVNNSLINGVDTAIGTIDTVDLPPNIPLTNAMTYLQPTQMTMDVDKSIQSALDKTREMAGVNQNILGASRPENAAALLTQIKQSNLPTNPFRDRLYLFLEKSYVIFGEFYKTMYDTTRKVMVDGEPVAFTGTDYADIDLQTKIDVGASQQWSEIVQLEVLNHMWDVGVIKDRRKYIKRIPHNLLALQDELIMETEEEEKVLELLATISQVAGIEMDPEMPITEIIDLILSQITQSEEQTVANPEGA